MTKILGKEKPQQRIYVLNIVINPLNAELNAICHLLALLGGATIIVVSRLRVNFQIASSLKINAPANSRRNS